MNQGDLEGGQTSVSLLHVCCKATYIRALLYILHFFFLIFFDDADACTLTG